MIVKMKKYAFLVYHHDYLNFLETLRDMGVVHIEEKEEGLPENESLDELMKLQARLKTAIRQLTRRQVEFKGDGKLSGEDALELCEMLVLQLENKTSALQSLEKEIGMIAPWGNFSWNTVEKLAEAGKHVHFFGVNRSKFDESWGEQYNAVEVSQNGSMLYFIVITDSAKAPDIAADLIRIPHKELKTLQAEKHELETAIQKAEHKLDQIAEAEIEILKDYLTEINNEFEFNKVAIQTERKADNRVMLLEGFVPHEQETALVEKLQTVSCYFQGREVEDTDKTPVLLKNNWFSKLFEPIGALYALPAYKEIDLTPFFAPFYWLFFGFCLGDTGYGLLLFFAGLVATFTLKNKTLVPYMKLVSLLGVSTILFGIISGTFFGINLYDTRWWFYADLVDMLAARGKTINDVMFSSALAFGAVQILFGMFIKAANEIKQKGWRYSIGTFGWLMLIIGAAIMYVLPKSEQPNLGTQIAQYAIFGVSGAMIFLYNSPGQGLLSNIGSGLWGAYNMATGLLGDILSYIRLFALGISSAILGFVFNMLSAQLSGSIPVVSFLIMLVILLIGHGINIFMSALGSFVHSMRLTFVEFYKNSNFEGGGKAYQPFSKK
jgi:V/A-type H+/Na+-transporting ATPase subunit I